MTKNQRLFIASFCEDLSKGTVITGFIGSQFLAKDPISHSLYILLILFTLVALTISFCYNK